MDIHAEIISKLNDMEQKENVTVLHAIESGSRAWGFASPDSDYDVRFVYVRRSPDYMRLEKVRDVIEWELNDVYDMSGWDVQKLFRLLHDSNPTIFEWLHSPVVYRTTPLIAQLADDIDSYFSPKKGLYHYLSTASSNYKKYIERDDSVKLKKYFYVLRPLFACQWILDNGTPPPVLFDELRAAVKVDTAVEDAINDLLRRKINANETEYISRVKVLDGFIEDSSVRIKDMADNMENQPYRRWDRLNEMFMECVTYGEGQAKEQ